ncbi:hypothetical protein [Ensifer sp. Root423]|uniref:hypothetical protein n=1 Tax=Ensifer sp. Root423 TaxID=1736534 RepID=UPI00138F81C3|nr:hypothetical protein [Ensifer sp. Root423]
MGSVRLLFRLGVAVEKIGQKIAQVGGRGEIHSKTSAHLGFGNSAQVVGDLNQAYARYAVVNGTFGDQVNKDCGLAIVKNLDLIGAQKDCAGFSQKNSPLLTEHYARYAASLDQSAVESRGI